MKEHTTVLFIIFCNTVTIINIASVVHFGFNYLDRRMSKKEKETKNTRITVVLIDLNDEAIYYYVKSRRKSDIFHTNKNTFSIHEIILLPPRVAYTS